MKKRNNTVKINKFMIIGIIFLFGAIFIKMGFIVLGETIDGMNLTDFASRRNTTKEPLYATRGNIYDAKGELLARNVNAYTVIAILSDRVTTDPTNPKHVVDKIMTAEALESVLLKLNSKMTSEYILSLLEKPGFQVELGPGGRDISEVVKNEIIKLDLPGIDFISSTKRYYPMDNFASYLIGYAKKNDDGEIIGEMGIESYFNDILKGKDGYREYQRDAYGYQIPNTNPVVEASESGSDIYLTIDNNIQLILEDAVKDMKENYPMDWITVTIADAKTGAILGSATDPNFNLNTLNITSYVNPLVGYQFEPGSTMKIFSWMAAIENGMYDGAKTFKSGAYKVGNDTVTDSNVVGWGNITFDEGFYLSSNVAASTLAGKLGRKNMREFYDSLGFGVKTGIELPGEISGKTNFVYDIEVATAAFGQGITTTPIQTIQALTTIANEGVMLKPFIINKVIDTNGIITHEGAREEVGRVASKDTIKEVKDLMKGVVEAGKTVGNRKPNNVTLIGKSGTAEIAGPNGKYLTGQYDVIKSFAGLFPYENPEYIIYFSSQKIVATSGQFFQKVMDIVDAIATKDTSINENIQSESSKTVTIKNYLSKNTEESEEALKLMNLNPIVLGSGDKVTNQYPLKNTTVIPGTKIFLLTNNKEYVMPSVIGWSSNEITTFCKLIGLKYKLEGYGKVKGVSLEEGSIIDLSAILVIELE